MRGIFYLLKLRLISQTFEFLTEPLANEGFRYSNNISNTDESFVAKFQICQKRQRSDNKQYLTEYTCNMSICIISTRIPTQPIEIGTHFGYNDE